jgi:GDP-mannose 6-dehydrogenase
VRVSQLTGTNADFIAAKLPHLNEIISDDLDTVATAAEVLVIANREAEFAALPKHYPHKTIVDLVRQYKKIDYEGDYEGISWGGNERN